MVDKLKQKEKNINKKLDTRKLRLVNRTLREISQIHDSRFLRLFEMTRWTLYFPTFAAFISSQFTAIVKSYIAWKNSPIILVANTELSIPQLPTTVLFQMGRREWSKCRSLSFQMWHSFVYSFFWKKNILLERKKAFQQRGDELFCQLLFYFKSENLN